MDVDTAVVSDRKGSIAVLSCSNHLEGKIFIFSFTVITMFVCICGVEPRITQREKKGRRERMGEKSR